METPVGAIETLFESVEGYTKTTLELSKLKVLETTTLIVTMLISRLSLLLILALFMLILNVGIGLWLGEVLGKVYYGFFIVAAFYFVAAIVLYFFLPNWIKTTVSNLIIKEALD